MENGIKIEVFKRETRKHDLKVKEKVDQCKNWLMDHKKAVVVLSPFVLNGIKNMISTQIRKNERVELYDPSVGHYWELKRMLSNKEWAEVDRRRNLGEKYGDILYSMGVLK